VQRVTVVGNSGSGKSTLSASLAARLGLPYVELDAIFHQPNWTELPSEVFRARVADVVAGESWVVDGNYSVVRDIVWARADTVVWLDLPRRTVTRSIVSRSAHRVVTRKELWAGNRERLRNLLAWDPERSIIRWSWTNHTKYADRYVAAIDDPAWSHLRFIRLRSRAAAAGLLGGAGPEPHQ
jgi:adenylate kinase family enzyme